MNKCDLLNRSTFYASDSLLEMAKEKNAEVYVNLAYTSYGGEYIDNVIIQYMENNYPDNIISERTSWNGRNAFLFGDVASNFLEESKNYILGFEDLEDFYFVNEHKAKIEGLKELGYTEEQIDLILDAASCGELNISIISDGTVDCNTTDINNYLNKKL